MANLISALNRANGMFRLGGLPFRIRERRHSPWLSVYEVLPGGGTKERAMHGYSASDPGAPERLYEKIVEVAKQGPSFDWSALTSNPTLLPRRQPTWPEICQAVVTFQRGQGVNMNLVGSFRGQGWFRLLPADRPATAEDVRRFALHTTESLKAHRLDPSEPLRPMATHKQGFRQKREVVSLLRRAGFGALAPEELSTELKGMVNRKKQALVAAGQSRRRIPTTEAIETWLDQVMVEDPLWGWVFAMVATYGLMPHEVRHIGTLPDENGLITVGEAAHHIKVTKTGFRAAVPLPAAWVERYGLGGGNGEQRLAELRARHRPKYVNEEGQPFDPARDAVRRCDNNERLGAICCHKLRSCDRR